MMTPSDEPLNLVLVEDDDADAIAIKRGLSKAGVDGKIFRAHDGVEALDMLHGGGERLPEKFIVLVDVNMPRMSGLEFLDELRKDPVLRRAIVFVLSTSRDRRDIEAAYSFNVAGYFVKEDIGRKYHKLVETLDFFIKSGELPPIPSAA